MMTTNIGVLENRLGHIFTDRDLLITAITHSSYAFEVKMHQPFNERLEFLGDAVLELVTSDMIFHAREHFEEGIMTKIRASLVCEATLADIANNLGLPQFLRMGKGEINTGGSIKASNLADAMEAIIAAVYLDGGLEVCREMVLRLLQPYIDRAKRGELIFDYKSYVLELSQKYGFDVQFNIIEQSGPAHNATFTAALYLDGKKVSEATAGSKKQAHQLAAKYAKKAGAFDVYMAKGQS